jgi:hypothetical protein
VGVASSALAARAGELTDRISRPLERTDYLGLVQVAKEVRDLADEVLAKTVDQSRDAGHTWQEIGDLLGVTRQAAFQRFGKPIDPRTGAPMDKTIHMTDPADRAIEIVEQVLDGRMDLARQVFNDQVRDAFTDEVRASGLASIAGMVGSFEGLGTGEPFVRRIGDHTVVDVPLRYEAGDMKARVAFDTDEKVAGLVIIPAETP